MLNDIITPSKFRFNSNSEGRQLHHIITNNIQLTKEVVNHRNPTTRAEKLGANFCIPTNCSHYQMESLKQLNKLETAGVALGVKIRAVA